MKIILTHEQADMDALASQLGAWLLYPDALPLLPHHINRNGRSFVNQYRSELPYLEREDLPREAIEMVILVDTQSMITLRGMQKDTLVRVYDHHPLKDDLDPSWELNLIKTGANTTQMVELLRQTGVELSPIQATTLMLGLYEDTGSFTYGSTTPEDLQAAGFCLAQGADLDIVADYLYPPLSTDQRRLYDRLLKKIQTYEVNGQTILAVRANAMDVSDEISSVAHKLRDVFNPDALLILVSTQQGIRLVARSTSDRVDVSEIAEAMGGGGHKRAASALIRPEEDLDAEGIEAFLQKEFDHLIDNLQTYVGPAMTVGAIMSRDPLLLSPDTPVEEAHRLMQRYGYEGYPVVLGGKVVGLLNRREVDRAIRHGLDLTVESLMAVGEVMITPDASLDELQSLMGASGWGQIPVISASTDEIIGIVTRTDLLKTLTPGPDIPSTGEVAEKLQQAVPAGRLALLHAVAHEADRVNLPIFVVGGFVRDLLLGYPSLDFDIVVEGDAIFFAKRLADVFGGRVLTHRRFSTAKWDIKTVRTEICEKLNLSLNTDPELLPENLDLITARTEFYEQPAALPTVESSSIKMDLHRRDFTINTLALRLDGEHYGQIYDYWGGLNDLEKGVIRVLHALSFVDDATRLLRAVRFETRFDFEIEPRTLALMQESLSLLGKLSGARLRHEINLLLAEPKAPAMMARLAELGILEAIHPALPWSEAVHQRLGKLDQAEPDSIWVLKDQFDHLSRRQVLGYLFWLGGLDEEALQAAASRLRFKGDLTGLLKAMIQLNKILPELRHKRPSEVVRLLENKPALTLYAAYLLSSDDHLREILYTYAARWRLIEPTITGDDLRQRGLRPSPVFGQILNRLRDAWLDGELQSKEDEKALLDSLMDELCGD